MNLFRRFNRWDRSLPIENRLAILAEHGVSMRPGRSIDELLLSWSRHEYENDPSLLLIALGGEVEEGPTAGERFSSSLWHFDTECIEDHGSYVHIAEQLREIAGGTLPLTDINDAVDIEAGEPWLSFTLDGREYRWDAEVDNDWVDPAILGRFAKLLQERRVGRRFAYLDTGGQDCLLGCFTDEQFRGLRKATGLEWMWLSQEDA